MKLTTISSCYIGPEISPEQFIPEHFFLYLIRGAINGYDGNKNYTLKPGEYCIARKNHLARYNKQKDDDVFGKIVVIFDEAFLKVQKEKHKMHINKAAISGAFVAGGKNERIETFIKSLEPYYNGEGRLDGRYADIKREELLLILLAINPELANVFFDFAIPQKINIEAFMNSNYKFNVSLERFAYLTGRSLSAFKRDFKQVFNDTPSHWLIQKRLRESYFLISKKGKKPTDIYLDLGFEDLSHFSFVFKKMFGVAPTALGKE